LWLKYFRNRLIIWLTYWSIEWARNARKSKIILATTIGPKRLLSTIHRSPPWVLCYLRVAHAGNSVGYPDKSTNERSTYTLLQMHGKVIYELLISSCCVHAVCHEFHLAVIVVLSFKQVRVCLLQWLAFLSSSSFVSHNATAAYDECLSD